jgi:hypothetical protein
MLKIFLIILAILVAIVAIFCIIVAFKSPDFRIQRSATLPAPQAVVFDQVNDFHNWDAWSPWAKLDPNCKNSFEGPTSGKGAGFAWAGNDKVGEGHMTITESKPNDLILINLEFIKPFANTCATEFTFKPEGEKTVVTWTMSGKNNFIGRAFCMFMDMDGKVGGDFEKGLAAMGTAAEAKAKQ